MRQSLTGAEWCFTAGVAATAGAFIAWITKMHDAEAEHARLRRALDAVAKSGNLQAPPHDKTRPVDNTRP